MEYLGAGEPVVNFLNVDKGITVLAIKINLNSSIKDIKIEQYKHYKYCKPFQKNITNITNRAKNCLTEYHALNKRKSY